MRKPWYASKTIWANGVAAVAAVAAAFGLDIYPEQQAALVGGIMAAVNIGLRLITKTGVTT